MSKMVLRPLSNMAIRLASRTPNRVFSTVAVSPIFSARACASVTGVSRMWWVMSRPRNTAEPALCPACGGEVERGNRQVLHLQRPLPNPPPQAGEGARRALLRCASASRSFEIDPARRDDRIGAARRMALDVDRDGIHRDVGRRHLDV